MRLSLVALLLPALVACGGDTDSSDADSGDDLDHASLADKIGCEGYQHDPELVGVKAGGECQVDGKDVYLYTFTDAEQRDATMGMARSGGGIWVEGDLWAVQTFDQQTADAVEAATS